jgi:nicotinamidase-related amidase
VSAHLVVIDLQEVFADPTSGWFTPRFEEILEPVDRLVEAFSEQVTFTRFIAPRSPQGAWRAYYERWPAALEPPDSPMYSLVDRYRTSAGDTVDTTTFSKWGAPLIERIGPACSLVLAGVSTDCCVLSTALAAADAGLHVLVAADACAAGDDISHESALQVMGPYAPLIELTTSSEAAELAGEAASPS